MKKQEMLDYIDKLIEDEIEAIDGYHKGIEKMQDSSRVVDLFGRIYNDETRHLTDLQDLKKAVEQHEEVMESIEMQRMFGLKDCGPVCMYGPQVDGIVITDEDKEKKE